MFQIEIECQPQLITDYKINFQDYKFLILFYSLSNELSNKSVIILPLRPSPFLGSITKVDLPKLHWSASLYLGTFPLIWGLPWHALPWIAIQILCRPLLRSWTSPCLWGPYNLGFHFGLGSWQLVSKKNLKKKKEVGTLL